MFSQLQKAQVHLIPPLIMPNGQKIARLKVEKEGSDSYDKYSCTKTRILGVNIRTTGKDLAGLIR